MQAVKPDSAQTCGLLERVARGDRQALEAVLTRYQPDLRAFVWWTPRVGGGSPTALQGPGSAPPRRGRFRRGAQ